MDNQRHNNYNNCSVCNGICINFHEGAHDLYHGTDCKYCNKCHDCDDSHASCVLNTQPSTEEDDDTNLHEPSHPICEYCKKCVMCGGCFCWVENEQPAEEGYYGMHEQSHPKCFKCNKCFMCGECNC